MTSCTITSTPGDDANVYGWWFTHAARTHTSANLFFMGCPKRTVSADTLFARAREKAPDEAIEVTVLSAASRFATWFENVPVPFLSDCTDKTRVLLPHCPDISLR
jgi:hypothetical protein